MVRALLAASLPHGHETAHSVAAAVPLAQEVVVAGGVIAAVLVLGLWSLAGHVITIAHEGGHAIVALLLGGRVSEVRLHRDRTGSTRSTSAFLMLPVMAAGYVAPSTFGLLGSLLLVHGRADAVLWISLVLLALMLASTANWFGRLLLVVLGVALFLTLQHGSPGVRLLVACVWVWLLLLGGLLHVWNHRRGGSDFAAMGAMTGVVPAFVWAGLSLVAASAALLAGAAWLVGAAPPPL